MAILYCGFVQPLELIKRSALAGFILDFAWPTPGPFQSPSELPNNSIDCLESQPALKAFNISSVITTQRLANPFVL